MTRKELAKYTRLSYQSIGKLSRLGDLPPEYQVCGIYLYNRMEVDEWIHSNLVTRTPTNTENSEEADS
ncbi:helix-turn-helix domain-containing protein [Bifidobacterium aerophilum]|uniref:helix-turn-helix domain-containing protein n=1 Tax=Bifidobacterium aerophilum TaxID=1798155 RepID=UPI0013D61A22|nr:helix-turn-helix domain-containing protein [Bifidobacterium aerophilum]